MSLNVHTDIELTPPRHHKSARPFMVVFGKKAAPLTGAASSKSIY